MPRIVEEKTYNGASQRIQRLGLISLLTEVRQIITGFSLLVEEKKDKNGGAAVRRLIDKQFKLAGGWEKTQTGGIDWIKCRIVNGTKICMGIEVQCSARSDLLIRDVVHLRNALISGQIDVGVIIVPSDRLSYFLTDRAPSMADAKRTVTEARAEDLPFLLISFEHDGPGPPLAKQKKMTRKKPVTRKHISSKKFDSQN